MFAYIVISLSRILLFTEILDPFRENKSILLLRFFYLKVCDIHRRRSAKQCEQINIVQHQLLYLYVIAGTYTVDDIIIIIIIIVLFYRNNSNEL